jgi:putative ATP-dependent endonuclease of OLD family
MQRLRKHDGGGVRTFPSEQWTLEFDLARQPGLAVTVHQAVRLARGEAGQTRDQIVHAARAEVEAWQADPQLTSDDVALRIFRPLEKNLVSKTEVAEQLASLVAALPDNGEELRAKLPAYLVSAVEHVTGGAGAPGGAQQAPPPQAGLAQ